ncbi:MAG: hypothetical protein AAF741_10120 [Bacteroidota bacterium]
MKIYSLSIFVPCLVALWMLSSCAQAPDFPNAPVITYTGLSANEVFVSSVQRDSILIYFSFTDGDGDLTNLDSNVADVFLMDTRDDRLITPLNFPDIDEEGTGNGISGDVTVVVDNQAFILCCIQTQDRDTTICDTTIPTNEYTYKIQVRDRAGNFSNIIETEPITMRCR